MKRKIRAKIKTSSKTKKRIDINKNHINSKIFLYFAVGLALLISTLLILEYVSFSFVSDIFSEEYKIDVKDDCSIIMGNLLHTIRDETDCSLHCNSRCEIDENNFIRSEFFIIEGGCNVCDCYCK